MLDSCLALPPNMVNLYSPKILHFIIILFVMNCDNMFQLEMESRVGFNFGFEPKETKVQIKLYTILELSTICDLL